MKLVMCVRTQGSWASESGSGGGGGGEDPGTEARGQWGIAVVMESRMRNIQDGGQNVPQAMNIGNHYILRFEHINVCA